MPLILPRRAVCLSLVAATGFAAHTQAATYNAIDITFATPAAYDVSQGRPTSPQFGLNTPGYLSGSGSVAGSGYTGYGVGNGVTRAGYYDASSQTLANLGDLEGDFGDPSVPRDIFDFSDRSGSFGINDAGWVVGYAGDNPFLFRDTDGNHANTAGEMVGLALNPGATVGDARGVNNAGHIVITGSGSNSSASAYLARYTITGGVATETAPRIQFTSNLISGGVSISESGVVGYTVQGQGGGYVFHDTNDNGIADSGETFTIPRMSEFGNSRVFDVNNSGQVLGTMKNLNNKDVGFLWTDSDGDHAFTWNDTNGDGFFNENETSSEVVRFSADLTDGIFSEEGNTFANALNDQGQVVGEYAVNSLRRAWIYDAVTGLQYLDGMLADPSFDTTVRRALDINEAGQILADGRFGTSTNGRSILLTPTLIPEPSTLALLGVMGCCVLRRRRHA